MSGPCLYARVLTGMLTVFRFRACDRTERTYVKGLQELVDIYIKPASATVTVLSGVSQIKDTVVPAQERKIVFSGLEALFYFHKQSFLPALERASSVLLVPAPGAAPDDGQLSLDVARDVANTFVSHAAFMKMYSTYIKYVHVPPPFFIFLFPWYGSADRRGLTLCSNFDNSVQRIKMWVSDKPSPAASAALSPSSSSAQLAGLGTIAAGIANPTSPDGGAASVTLSSGQRKRVKQYLKRCRMNPRHSQLNLEGYLLLPVQRIPRYRLLVSGPLRLVLNGVSLPFADATPGAAGGACAEQPAGVRVHGRPHRPCIDGDLRPCEHDERGQARGRVPRPARPVAGEDSRKVPQPACAAPSVRPHTACPQYYVLTDIFQTSYHGRCTEAHAGRSEGDRCVRGLRRARRRFVRGSRMPVPRTHPPVVDRHPVQRLACALPGPF